MPKRTISNRDKKSWGTKTFRLNQHEKLRRGHRVQEVNGYIGVVVKIIEGNSEDDHGFVYVWQEERMEYGADNCEHYCYSNWKSFLRIIPE